MWEVDINNKQRITTAKIQPFANTFIDICNTISCDAARFARQTELVFELEHINLGEIMLEGECVRFSS